MQETSAEVRRLANNQWEWRVTVSVPGDESLAISSYDVRETVVVASGVCDYESVAKKAARDARHKHEQVQPAGSWESADAV